MGVPDSILSTLSQGEAMRTIYLKAVSLVDFTTKVKDYAKKNNLKPYYAMGYGKPCYILANESGYTKVKIVLDSSR
jgi:hypothetical protein